MAEMDVGTDMGTVRLSVAQVEYPDGVLVQGYTPRTVCTVGIDVAD